MANPPGIPKYAGLSASLPQRCILAVAVAPAILGLTVR